MWCQTLNCPKNYSMGLYKRLFENNIDTCSFLWITNNCFWLKSQRWIRRYSINFRLGIFPWLWLITALSILNIFWQTLHFAVSFDSIARQFLNLLYSDYSNLKLFLPRFDIFFYFLKIKHIMIKKMTIRNNWKRSVQKSKLERHENTSQS